jgi:hypothetical protein
VATGELPWEGFDRDFEIHDHDIPDAGVYRGRDGFARWAGDWAAAWQSFEMVPAEYVDAGDRVVALFTVIARGRGSGIEVNRRDAIVYTFAGNRVTRLDYFNDPEQALQFAAAPPPP